VLLVLPILLAGSVAIAENIGWISLLVDHLVRTWERDSSTTRSRAR